MNRAPAQDGFIGRRLRWRAVIGIIGLLSGCNSTSQLEVGDAGGGGGSASAQTPSASAQGVPTAAFTAAMAEVSTLNSDVALALWPADLAALESAGVVSASDASALSPLTLPPQGGGR